MRLLAIFLMWFCALVTFAGMYELELASDWFVALLVFMALQVIAIFVHELGHAVAARKRGASLEAFAVLEWEYDFRTRRFGRVRQLTGRDVGGYVTFSFGEIDITRRDDAIITAAGPAANGLLALVSFAVAFALSPAHYSTPEPAAAVVPYDEAAARERPIANLPSTSEGAAALEQYDEQRRREAVTQWLENAASVLAVLSLGMALINLIPFSGSDGDRLWWALSRKRSWPRPKSS